MIACGVLLNKISPNYQVIGHRQSRVTACPGEVFYSYVKSMPRWTSTPVPVYNNNSSLIDKVDSDKKN